jgi:ribonuclease-3
MDFNKSIEQIEKTLGYTFRDKSLLKQAFTRESYCNEDNRGKTKFISNEVLEFFGDSILSAAIVSLLLKGRTKKYEYGIYTELGEGDFSTIRSNLSDKKNLSSAMGALGLEKYLLLSRGDAKLGIEKEPSVMEDLYESIIGAIYIDSGMDLSVVVSVVERTLDVSSYISEAEAPKKNAKNLLQEWCDDKKHRLPHPEYKVLSATGPDNKKTYECGVYIGEKLYAKGVGKNQKLAEAEAAKLALEILKAEAKQPKVDAATVAQKLRELGSKNKVPSAEYRDLGETENSTINVKEYAIECRFMGKVATGTGLSKQDARAAAGLKILEEIEKEKAENAKKTLTKASKKAPKK